MAHTTELLDQAQQQLHPAESEEDEEEEDPEEIQGESDVDYEPATSPLPSPVYDTGSANDLDDF